MRREVAGAHRLRDRGISGVRPVDGAYRESAMDSISALAGGAALDTSAAAALGIGLTGLGAALAQGRAVAAALDGSTRNPGALSGARGLMILGLGMIESVLVLVAVFLMTRR